MNLLLNRGFLLIMIKGVLDFFSLRLEGFHFKSLEGLFNQKQKKSYIFNNSTDIQGTPAGYDGKILKYQSNST